MPSPNKNVQKKCECACHMNILRKPYGHDTVCCDEMNGHISNDIGFPTAQRTGDMGKVNYLHVVPNSRKPVGSSCCKATLRLGGDGETKYYICTKCDQATDMVGITKEEDEARFAPPPVTKEEEWERLINDETYFLSQDGYGYKWIQSKVNDIKDIIRAEKEKSYEAGEIHGVEQLAETVISEGRKDTLSEIIGIVEGMKINLVVQNDGGNCNPRCHDSGRESSCDDLLSSLKDLLKK